MTIFISHSSRDRKVTESLCRALEARGWHCWMSHRDVKPGNSFQAAIAQAISQCNIMILIFTGNANDSPEIAKELALASQNKLIVIPLRFEDIAPNLAFSYELSTRQWIDMFEDWEQGLRRLVDHIKKVMPETADKDQPAVQAGMSAQRSESKSSLTKPLMAASIGVLVLLGGLFYWNHLNKTLPPHLSIVVLPFSNTSGDPTQDYVADAITDDITVELSKIKGSFVIGRGTAFSFKGTKVDLKAVARELNVRYILQGTASKTDSNFHVTVELIDGLTGANIWADTLDRKLPKIDEVRRDVVFHLASALHLQLISAESKTAVRTKDPDAIDLTMKAWANYNGNRVSQEIVDLLGKALTIQPNYEPALVLRANMKSDFYIQDPGIAGDRLLAEAEQDAMKAIELDPTDARAYHSLAEIKRYQHDTNAAILANNRALEMNPNDAESVSLQARLLIEDGKAALAIEQAEKAMSLSPLDTNLFTFLWAKCHATLHLGNFQGALPVCEKTWGIAQFWFNAVALIDIYEAVGDSEKAGTVKKTVLAKYPHFTIGFYKEHLGSDNSTYQKEVEAYVLPGLRKAGFSE